MAKTHLTVYIDNSIVEEIKGRGSNTSEIVENLLRVALNTPSIEDMELLNKCKVAILKMAKALNK